MVSLRKWVMSWKPEDEHHKHVGSKRGGGLSEHCGSRKQEIPHHQLTVGHRASTQGCGEGGRNWVGVACSNQHLGRLCQQIAPGDQKQTLTVWRGMEEHVVESNREVTEAHIGSDSVPSSGLGNETGYGYTCTLSMHLELKWGIMKLEATWRGLWTS